MTLALLLASIIYIAKVMPDLEHVFDGALVISVWIAGLLAYVNGCGNEGESSAEDESND